ncbi:hypothetical protein L484_001799 [Morus notabilis]|uniref:Uncharacterized protein n=1 Tax=Morus notabilis TaxID=981085 RepID=W9SD11_9ROSA|nr:hypothetical protein L484_001799 [Morus notabilis]
MLDHHELLRNHPLACQLDASKFQTDKRDDQGTTQSMMCWVFKGESMAAHMVTVVII